MSEYKQALDQLDSMRAQFDYNCAELKATAKKLKRLGYLAAIHETKRIAEPHEVIAFSIRHNIFGYQKQSTFYFGKQNDLNHMNGLVAAFKEVSL